jgi:hypothetical protein
MEIKIVISDNESESDVIYKIINYLQSYTLKDKVIKTYKDIKSFEDACVALKTTPETIIGTQTEQRFINQLKLETIIKALNEGWKPDFNDNNQKKYYNWFSIIDGEFVFGDTYYTYGGMYVPSALYFKNEELAIYCMDNFFDLYEEYYLNIQ